MLAKVHSTWLQLGQSSVSKPFKLASAEVSPSPRVELVILHTLNRVLAKHESTLHINECCHYHNTAVPLEYSPAGRSLAIAPLLLLREFYQRLANSKNGALPPPTGKEGP